GIEDEELVASLVRQWLAFGGHATVLSEREQLYLDLIGTDATPGDVAVDGVPTGGWFGRCLREWEFDDEQLDGLLRDLNREQAAVLENRHGRAFRIWVDPSER